MPGEDYLTQLLDRALRQQRRKKDFVRRVSWGLRIAIVALSASTTVVLGITTSNQSLNVTARNTALFMSAAITFLSSMGGFWNVDQYWIHKKVTLGRLVLLKEQYDFRRSEAAAITPQEIAEFFSRYQEVIIGDSKYWEDIKRGLAVEPAGRTSAARSVSPDQPKPGDI